MSTNDPIGDTQAAALHWNLVPQDARHDLLIRCLQHTTPGGCIDALAAAYDEKEIGEIADTLNALRALRFGSREQKLDHSGWLEHIRRTIR